LYVPELVQHRQRHNQGRWVTGDGGAAIKPQEQMTPRAMAPVLEGVGDASAVAAK